MSSRKRAQKKGEDPIDRVRAAAGVLLLLTLVIAAVPRFFMLSEIGIRGDDTIYYLSLAKGWAEPLYDAFRPVITTIYRIVVSVGGDSDWSVKGFNASLDVLNVLLIFLITRRICGRPVPALLAALSYGLLPRAFSFARTELLHTGSTTFILAAFSMFVLYADGKRDDRRLLFLTLSGFFAGLSFGVHEDLLLFVPGVLVSILLASLNTASTAGRRLTLDVRRALSHMAFYLGSVVATMSPLGFWTAFIRHIPRVRTLVASSVVHDEGQGGVSIGYPELIYNMIQFNTSTTTVTLFLTAVVVSLVIGIAHVRNPPKSNKTIACRIRSQQIKPALYSPWILVLTYLLLYPVASNFVWPRLMLPGTPLVLMSIVLWADHLSSVFITKDRHRSLAVGAVGLWLIIHNLTGFQEHRDMRKRIRPAHQSSYRLYSALTIPRDLSRILDRSQYPISGYRLASNLMKDRVDGDHRLLILPSIISSAGGERRGFRHYFGDDAVYVEDCRDSLPAFIEHHRIRYVLISKFHLKGLGDGCEPSCFGLTRSTYSVEKELKWMVNFLRRGPYRVRPLHQDPLFTVLEIERR